MANTPSRGGGILDKAPLPVIGGIAALVVIGIIVVGVALSSGGNDSANGGNVTAQRSPTPTSISGGLQTAQPSPIATTDLSQPTTEAENWTSLPDNARFVIPRFNVDAPLTYRAVGTDGVMPNPAGPDDIAYYDFSAWPGLGGHPSVGNTVVSGHVDSGHEACKNGTVPPPCEAVLWDLNNLNPGDELHVVVDGTLYRYAVTSNEPVHAVTGPWDQIVASSANPTLTVITCGGDFNRDTGEYEHRQVVRAEFVGQEPVS